MADASPPLLEIDSLTVVYGRGDQQLAALREVSLHIAAGQAYGLVGESGSGKTTLGLAVLRYLPEGGRIVGGRVLLAGQDMATLTPAEMKRVWRSQIKLVPQDPLSALNPSLRIGDQMGEALHAADPGRPARPRVLARLREVGMADPQRVAASYPHQLSGGMLQRVLIAMALSGEDQPSLLVLDEPTTNLDVTTEAAILDLVRELATVHRTAILYVTHNLAAAASLCDRIAVLYGGELVEELGPEALRRPLHPYTRGLVDSAPRLGQRAADSPLTPLAGLPARRDAPHSGCVFAPRCPIVLQRCIDERPELETADSGDLVRCHRWRAILAGEVSAGAGRPALGLPRGAAEVGLALETVELAKLFPIRRSLRQVLRRTPSRRVRAVDGVSLGVGQGRTLGLVGESGSGKTTTARCIVGLVERSGGEVNLFGVTLAPDIARRDPETLRRLQMVFQNPDEALNPSRTVGDVLGRPLKRLAGLSGQEARRQSVRLLEAVRLDAGYLERTPGQLSGGEKQRVAIARALASNPAVLVLDEAVSSLDVSVQAAILNLLAELQGASGSAYLFISHDLAVVSYLADDVAVMYGGQIVELGPAGQVMTPPHHPYTEALLAAAPRLDRPSAGAVRLAGDAPTLLDAPGGCPFFARCPRVLGEVCRGQDPPWQQAGAGHRFRCHIEAETLAQGQQSTLAASSEQIAALRRETGDAAHAGSGR